MEEGEADEPACEISLEIIEGAHHHSQILLNPLILSSLESSWHHWDMDKVALSIAHIGFLYPRRIWAL